VIRQVLHLLGKATRPLTKYLTYCRNLSSLKKNSCKEIANHVFNIAGIFLEIPIMLPADIPET